MKRKLIGYIISVAMIVGMAAPLMADENKCWLQAPAQNDIYVKVHDADRDGNRLGVLWKGKIKAGEKKEITSPHGNIRYDWTFSPSDGPDGDINRSCADGEIILLP